VDLADADVCEVRAAWVGRCMIDDRAGGRGIIDDVSWSNFLLRSLTLGLLAEAASGMFTGPWPLPVGEEVDRRLGRKGVREADVVGGGLGISEAGRRKAGVSTRDANAGSAMDVSLCGLAGFGSTPA
jgi:hypothetical protein